MIDIKYVTFRRRDGRLGVIEAMELEDKSWLLIDTYKDLSDGIGLSFEWERVGRENIVGSYSNFEQIVNFLRMLCGGCEVMWV